MFKSFFKSREWAPWAYGGLLILLLSVTAQVQLLVKLNTWYKHFYDLLQVSADRNISEFWDMIVEFYQIAFAYITIATVSSFLSRHYTFRWRQAMTFYYLPIWSKCNKDVEGSSQRLQEDTFRFSRIVETLGLDIFEAVLSIISFAPILWMLSEHVILPFMLAGSLFWVAVSVSVGGMLISLVVGIKLPQLEYNNQRVEAAFRKQLVYAEDDKELANPEVLAKLFFGLRVNYFRLYLHYGYFDLWRIFFLQSISLVPVMLVAPALFSGAIMVGTLIQANHSFGKVVDGFSILVRNWTTITELQSVIKRLREFEKTIGVDPDADIDSAPPVIAVKKG